MNLFWPWTPARPMTGWSIQICRAPAPRDVAVLVMHATGQAVPRAVVLTRFGKWHSCGKCKN